MQASHKNDAINNGYKNVAIIDDIHRHIKGYSMYIKP